MRLISRTCQLIEVFTHKGGKVSVTCVAQGAKPAAYIYWNSEPELDLNDIHEEVSERGDTFQTLNRLTFPAERKLTSLSCFAANQVLDEKKGQHLKQVKNTLAFISDCFSKSEFICAEYLPKRTCF